MPPETTTAAPPVTGAPPKQTTTPKTTAAPPKPAAGTTPPKQEGGGEKPADPKAKPGNPFFDDIDKLMNTPAKKPAEKTEEAPKEGEETPVENLEKEGEEKTAEPKPGEKQEEQPKKIGDVRTAYETAKKENQRLQQELESIKKGKNQEDPDRKALSEKLEHTSRRNQELEEQLKLTQYEKSEEYKTNFEQPVLDAFDDAVREVTTMRIESAEGDRSATDQDFIALLKMNTQEAAKAAKEWFGEAASEVMAHRRTVMSLTAKRQKAIDEYRQKGSEREKEMQAREAQNREKRQKLFTESHKEAVEKFPELFAPEDGDTEGNEVLENGMKLAEAAFAPPKNLPPEQVVQLHALTKVKAGAFDRMVYRNNKLKEENAQLKEQLKAYEESEPGAGDGGRKPTTGRKSFADEVDELATQRKEKAL
jgi:hypothetical protein